MTTFRRFCVRGALLGGCMSAAVLLGAAAVHAQTATQQANQRQQLQYQRNVSQQQLSNQLRDNQISEQQRQRISNSNKQPYTSGSSTSRQIQKADQARRDRYEAHQQDVLDSYRSAETSQPAPAHASSSGQGSGGH